MADSSPKIRAPTTKIYDIPAKTVWDLLGISRKNKNEIDRKIRAVWEKYLKGQEDQFSSLPKGLLDKATEALVQELPEIFDKCEGTWFAKWAFFNRHKGRFRESARRNPVAGAENGQNEPNEQEDEIPGSPEVGTPVEE